MNHGKPVFVATRATMIALTISWFALIAVVILLVLTERQVENERDNRAHQVNLSLLINCRKREQEMAVIRRLLKTAVPTPFDCNTLPVLPR